MQGRTVDGEKYDNVRNVDDGEGSKGNLNDVLRLNQPDSASSEPRTTAVQS